MVGTLLRLVSTVASALVILSFALFAVDEAREGSETQVRALDQAAQAPDPTARGEERREKQNSAVRELVDDANDGLVKPFAGVTDSDSDWVKRGVPALLAVLVYGVLLRMLAGYVPGLRKRPATRPGERATQR